MNDIASRFDRGARHYDLLVGLNPGYHEHLRSAARELAKRIGLPPTGVRLLDLACGSGASTSALLGATGLGAHIVGVDLSRGMLEQATAKRWPDGVRFQLGRVGNLDVPSLGTASWHGVFASYLFRNIQASERGAALAEVHTLLAPGGWLVTQEYSVAGNPFAGAAWDVVNWGIIMPLGIIVDRNPGLYRYLRQSVHDFDSRTEFMDRLAGAGFVDVACRTVPGWQRGILHTFVGRKAVR